MSNVISPVPMNIPKVDLSDLLSPEEPGKIYIGPNINWANVPGVLSNLLTLADPSGMIGGPAALTYKTLPKAAGLWAQEPLKQLANSTKAAYRLETMKNPALKQLFEDTSVIFHENIPTFAGSIANVRKNTIKVMPIKDNLEKFLKTIQDKNLSKTAIKKVAQGMAKHEINHFTLKDPDLYKQAKELFDKVDPATQAYMTQRVLTPRIMASFSDFLPNVQQKVMERRVIEEFINYASEANILGEGTFSKTAKDLYSFASKNPELKQILKETENLKLTNADNVLKRLEDLRSSNAEHIAKYDPYLLDEIKKVIQDEQRKVISTTSKGITKSRTAPAREVTLVPRTEKEAVKEVVGQRKRIKEYIPNEEGPKPVSTEPSYTNPQRTQDDEFIDGILREVTSPPLRTIVENALRRAFEKINP